MFWTASFPPTSLVTTAMFCICVCVFYFFHAWQFSRPKSQYDIPNHHSSHIHVSSPGGPPYIVSSRKDNPISQRYPQGQVSCCHANEKQTNYKSLLHMLIAVLPLLFFYICFPKWCITLPLVIFIYPRACWYSLLCI